MKRIFNGVKFQNPLGARGAEYLDPENPTKRGLDVVVSSLFLGVFALPMAGIAVGSAIDTRSNPILRQQRIDLSQTPTGDELEALKGALEEDLPKELLVEYIKFRTMRGKHTKTYGVKDPRASKYWGQPLRGSGGDESPQDFSVLKGDFSMVGRRDVLMVDVQDMHAADPILLRDLKDRLNESNVKPAVLSPDSVWGHRYPDAEQTADYWRMRMRLMYAYPENASLGGDLTLLAQAPYNMIAAQFRPLGDYVELIPAAEDSAVAA